MPQKSSFTMQVDQMIRSRRKTIAILVTRDGKVIVRAPLRARNADIQAFLERKAGWIRAKVEEFRNNPAPQHLHFQEGETLFFLGKAYPIQCTNRSSPVLVLEKDHFSLSAIAQGRSRDVFTTWFHYQASKILEERVKIYAQQFNLAYLKIRITSARTRWGSCSPRGNLSFTYRLVMAPLPIIDYVVIHELAHLIVPNHSNRFWAQVQTMLPDYANRKDWLRKNGQLLRFE